MILRIVLVGDETEEIDKFFKKHCGENFQPNALNNLRMEISVKRLQFKDD